jgi:hypothetical protein
VGQQQDFEARVLNLWMTTRVPMTRANLLFYTKAPRKKVAAWLDELTADGVLEVDADDAGEMIWIEHADNAGEMIWTVRGAERAPSGPTRLEEAAAAPETASGDLAAKLERLKREALTGLARAGTSLAVPKEARALLRTTPGQKNLAVSGLLSLFFGPFGLLYAAPYRVAVPLSVAMVLAMVLLGWHAIGFSLLFALLGVGYAWRYNQRGERAPLLGGDEPGPRALPRKR